MNAEFSEDKKNLASQRAGSPLVCWVVTDGRAGIEAQALGLAEAMARLRAVEIVVKRVRLAPPWDKLPSHIIPKPSVRLSSASDPVNLYTKDEGAIRQPDIWIGCGRQSVPLTIEAARATSSGEGRRLAPFRVQLQHPRRSPDLFDIVIAPEHDDLQGANVHTMIGAPNRICPERLEMARRRLPAEIIRIPQKKIAVLVGGPNREFEFAVGDGDRLVQLFKALVGEGYVPLVTTSRRTPPAVAALLSQAINEGPGWFHDPLVPVEGQANPYPGLLSICDAAIVTGDSVNMMSEAATAGVPVYRFDLSRRDHEAAATKFDRLFQRLHGLGLARDLPDNLKEIQFAAGPAFNETDRVAAIVLVQFDRARA